MVSTKSVFIAVVLALLIAPMVYFSAVLEHETQTEWNLHQIAQELRALGDKVNDQVCRQDRATEEFIEKTTEDLQRLNGFLDRLADFEIECDEPPPCPPGPPGPPVVVRVKGNNGVGNGLDPQPPGNPPVNDGPGTGPGNPGNRGGGGAG